MSITVLLADGSDVMRPAIVRLLNEEPSIELVAEAKNFAETLRLCLSLKPDILLLDPHMSDEGLFPAEFIKPQIVLHTRCVIALSVWDDADVNTLAESLGAKVLLDKTRLYRELIPTIVQFCPKIAAPIAAIPFVRILETRSQGQPKAGLSAA